MHTYVILRRSGWSAADDLERAAGICARVNTQEMPDRVRWIRSYVLRESDGRLGTACIFQARDEQTLREHARRAGMPCDAVLPVSGTIVINDDPPLA
jgi:hypothetical protein